MSLQYVAPQFIECPSCAAKPGSPTLCRECLERRELWHLVDRMRRSGRPEFKSAVQICAYCSGSPRRDCPEHGA